MSSSPLLMTPPLQLAICEVRFPGDPEVEVQRGAFYRKIKQEFPSLYVPNVSDGQPLALQHYRFVSRNEDWLALAVNSFAYGVTSESYKSFEVFKNSFMSYLAQFRDVYSHLEGFTRIGLRYINHLPVKRGAEGEIAFVPMKLPSLINGQVQNTLHVTEHQINNGVIRVVIDTTQEGLSPNLALLDFDFVYSADIINPIPVSDLGDRLEDAHEVVKDILRSLIVEDYAREVGIT
jgi:uncharacterized protein (TIGR04255 family)